MTSSWEPVHKWYNAIVGDEGHYYHREVIFPKLLDRWKLKATDSLLDMACGQGVFARQIPPSVDYLGLDISPSLIAQAKAQDKNSQHRYQVSDACKVIKLQKCDYSHALILLAFQNFADPLSALKNINSHLKTGGKLALVLNHPCFRIPRQSSWGVDESKKLQYRRIDRYMSPLEIPIEAHPGSKTKSPATFSYHHSLSDISRMLSESGFVIENIEEWCSNKQSGGAKAKMENRAREEFPLFLTIFSSKI